MAKAEKLTPMQVGEAEDELSDWLDDHGVDDGWDLAPALVAAGVNTDWLDEIADSRARRALLADGIHWVAYALETEQLMVEIEDSTDRISTLVGAAKQYSQLDRAAPPGHRRPRRADQHPGHARPQDQGVGHDHGGQGVRRVLPLIPAHPAELNQVWTNLIDNAVQAMPDGGTLTVRTALDGECVLVEIGDTGAGSAEGAAAARSSSRSSPPSRWARAPGSAWTSPTG